MDRLRAAAASRGVRSALALVLVAAAVVVGLDVTAGPSSYRLNAVYASAPGLFPGAAVDVLGVPVGTVTSVTNVHDHVEVGMQLHAGARIPAAADASLVAPELLGQPDVDLNPGYTGGAYLRPGATIAESHTSVPVSTDQLLTQLRRTLKAINPHAVGDLITNLAQDLNGQGAGLNKLLGSAAGTLQLLADKGVGLGQLNGTLAQLTGTLDTDTSQIEQLVREYDTVSTVISQHSGQLNGAVTQLAGASTSLVTLLTPNLQPLEADVGTVTTVGRTLDRNIGNVDQILAQANNLFHGAQRAFDPTYNWLDLNLALPPGVTGDYVAGLIRDRLAGVCRRIVANHAAGLTATMLTSLTSCGDPDSTFFDPLINEIPGILSGLTGSAASSAGTALLQQGLDQIGSIGATPGTSPSPSTSTQAGPTGHAPAGSSSPTTSTTTPPSTTTTTPPPPPTCGLLGTLLGCPGGSTATGGGSSPPPSSDLGGLLSYDVASTKAHNQERAEKKGKNEQGKNEQGKNEQGKNEQGKKGTQPTVRLASNDPNAPSLNAPAARLLAPLPSAHHAPRAHQGLLSHWAHDLTSWL
jgi:phospholipid/cholesterol/gamma-HCH transport system substrate-binding protein